MPLSQFSQFSNYATLSVLSVLSSSLSVLSVLSSSHAWVPSRPLHTQHTWCVRRQTIQVGETLSLHDSLQVEYWPFHLSLVVFRQSNFNNSTPRSISYNSAMSQQSTVSAGSGDLLTAIRAGIKLKPTNSVSHTAIRAGIKLKPTNSVSHTAIRAGIKLKPTNSVSHTAIRAGIKLKPTNSVSHTVGIKLKPTNSVSQAQTY